MTLDIKGLFKDEGAVSPVIGVILMVAITVILAAVIGTFVLGLGDQIKTTTPSSNFQIDYNDDVSAAQQNDGTSTKWDNVTITHTGGDGIGSQDINLTVTTDYNYLNGSEGKIGNTIAGVKNKSKTFNVMLREVGANDKVTAGDTVYVGIPRTDGRASVVTGQLNGETLRIVWSGGDKSTVLRTFDFPE